MRKKTIVSLVLILVLSISVGAVARLTLFSRASSTLSFTGSTAKCRVTATCNSDVESITAEVTLYYEGSNGRLYESASWPTETVSANTYSFLEYAYNRTSGKTYVLEAVLTATDGEGNQETVTVTDEIEY